MAQEEVGPRGDMISTTTKAAGKKHRLAFPFIKLDSKIKSCTKKQAQYFIQKKIIA